MEAQMRTDQQLSYGHASLDTRPPQHSGYEVTMTDTTVENIGGADAYAQEGPLTTFFDTGGRDVVDSWAVRLMSLRTADIAKVKRTGPRPFAPVLPITMAS